MNLVAISDTHGFHRDLENIPDGDILIHCGDISNVGERDQVEDFIDWLKELPHKHKIFIAGNHDRSFDPKFNDGDKPEWLKELLADLLISDYNIHYLENESVVIDGITFWGSPITPDFYPKYWAFNKPRGEEIRKIWRQIDANTDVLITHGPPYNIKDYTKSCMKVGCEDLSRVVDILKPKCHFFGHIHEDYGALLTNGILYANVSVLNENYRMSNPPLIFELE
jgi:Icc-related predicted phosphoesterase